MSLYTLTITSGILAALLMLHPSLRKSRAGRDPIHSTETLDTTIICTLAGLAGGRAFFVLIHWAYYAQNPGQIPQIWQGGMDWAGVLFGFLLAALIKTGFSLDAFLRFCNRVCFPVLVVAFSHYAGCFLSGCLIGAETELFSFLPASPDALGEIALRWPGAALAALAVILSTYIAQQLHSYIIGLQAALTLSLLALIQLGVTFTLGPPAALWRGFRLDTLEAALVLVLALLGSGLLFYRSKRKKKHPHQSSS